MPHIDKLEELSADIDDIALSVTQELDSLREEVTADGLENAQMYLEDLIAVARNTLHQVQLLETNLE